MSAPAPGIDLSRLDLVFPEPAIPLLQGAGEPCSWRECMRETAAQTIYFLRHYGHLPPPPLPDEPFRLDPAPGRARPSAPILRLLALLPPGREQSAAELRSRLGLKHPGHFRDRYLHPALQAGLIERTHPASPSHPRQRYRARIPS